MLGCGCGDCWALALAESVGNPLIDCLFWPANGSYAEVYSARKLATILKPREMGH